MTALRRAIAALDLALLDAGDAFEIDKLVAARQCLVATSHPTMGSSTRRHGQRRAFVKWCPKCEAALPAARFNRNASKRDGLQTVCRECQRRLYQEHSGALALR